MGVTSPYFAGPGGNLGTFLAWDAASARKARKKKESDSSWWRAQVTTGDVAIVADLPRAGSVRPAGRGAHVVSRRAATCDSLRGASRIRWPCPARGGSAQSSSG